MCSVCVHWSTISPSCELLWLNVLPAIKLPTIRIIRTRHYNAYNHRISYSKEVEHFSAINTWAHHRAPKFFRGRGWEITWDTGDLPDTGSTSTQTIGRQCGPVSRRRYVKSLIKSSNWYPRQPLEKSPTFDFSWFLHISPHISPVKILGGEVHTGRTQLADATALAL